MYKIKKKYKKKSKNRDKISENLTKSRKISKNHFFERNKFRRKEISIWPELSSPARFRIQTDKENPKKPGKTEGKKIKIKRNPKIHRKNLKLSRRVKKSENLTKIQPAMWAYF